MNDVISEIDCFRVDGDEREKKREPIAIEKEIQLIMNDQPINSFLYSAGLDEQLVVGYLVSSGLISNLKDIERIEIEEDVCKVWASRREDQQSAAQDVGLTVSHRKLIEIRARLLENQKHHKKTGGFHGAIIWELSTGKWFVCEDIGRHNAVDKVIGYGLQEGYKFPHSMVLLSGRLISNIVSKCRNSGIPLMASMTVATDGGIRQAVDSNMTLIGSLSEDGFWLYNEGVVKVT
ncbi:MAG: formate dehydrogenase accessory sulfurtransferase FdhD [Promethearchaeota archaeon]